MHWHVEPSPHGILSLQPLEHFPAGLLYGYGVYTTFRLPIAKRWLNAHFDRLENDARTLGLVIPGSRSQLHNLISQAYIPEQPILRLSLVADIAGYGDFYTGHTIPAQLLISSRPNSSPNPTGLRLKTFHYQRPLSLTKLAPIAELVHWRRQAMIEGFDDLLLINTAGHCSETSTANLFFIKEGQLYTQEPTRDHCLPGITRLQVLESAQALELTIHVEPVSAESAQHFDGAFLCNAAQGLMPVQSIDNIPLPWPNQSQGLLKQLQQAVAHCQAE